MEKDIRPFVDNCSSCNKHRPRPVDSTDKWKNCGPWERLHMDWLYEKESRKVFVISDARSGWLEASPCTDRTLETVNRCLRKIFSYFEITHTVVSDNGKELITKDINECHSTHREVMV